MLGPSGEKLLLVPCREEDREYLWWLHRETMWEYVDKTWGWDEAFQRKKFDEGFDPPALQMIEIDGGAVGYIRVRREPDAIFLASIEIAPESQNKGIGSRLIEDLLREGERMELPVKLLVLRVNPARRLYERLGFECTNETETHFEMWRMPSTKQSSGGARLERT